MVFLISYDLKESDRDYARVVAVIKRLGPTLPVLKSVWFVRTGTSANDIRDALMASMDETDRFLVSEVTTNCTGRVEQAVWDWVDAQE